MARIRLANHYRKRRGFRYFSATCECNSYYRKDYGKGGTVTIRYAKCKGNEREVTCPVEYTLYRDRELISKVTGEFKTAQDFDAWLVDFDLINPQVLK